MKYTTLNKIRSCSPCESGWKKLLKHLGKTVADDEPLSFVTILESNGLDDALWCCRATPEYNREWRLYAVWCALQVKHLMTDKRSLDALVISEVFANGLVGQAELDAARDAAWAVEVDGATARDAAVAAARAARDAAWATARAAEVAAWDAQKECFLWVVNGGLTKFEARHE